MQFDRVDIVLYFYIVGIILSGVFLERLATPFDELATLAFAFIAGGVWLAYYKLSIAPRSEYIANRGTEDA
jgi:hypothetical protein